MPEIEFEHHIDPCKQMLQDGKTVDDILKYLRIETDSKVASMAVLMQVLNITPSEAKVLVHKSEVWEGRRERDEKFHEDVFSALEELNRKK